MGIDIRDGSQLACINCGLCADACDEVMARVGRPQGLVAYDTDSAVTDRVEGRSAVYRLIRPRTLVYAGALALVAVVMLWGLTHRTFITVHVLRDRNPTFVRLHDGAIRNGYTLKIANRSFITGPAKIVFEGPKGAHMETPASADTTGPIYATVEANTDRAVRVFVTAPETSLHGPRMPAKFTVTLPGGVETVATTFVSDAEDEE